MQTLDHFVGARRAASPQRRLAEVRERARAFRADLLGGGTVRYYRSFPLVRVPYPARYGFLNASGYGLLDKLRTPSPLLHIVNKMFIVQFDTSAGVKTLLISPSDVDANRATPFFTRLSAGLGPARSLAESFLAPRLGSVAGALVEAGLSPEDVDYIAYDHLHTQDIRRWLGSAEAPGFFPHAKLLVTRQEWVSASAPLPPQADWYCPGGTVGVPEERVVFFEQDTLLGQGMALMRTPGHTEGNHSFVVATPEGLFVTSENGIGPDSYAPLASSVPGLRAYALDTGMEVILNGNTLEGGLDQYISMVQEKEVAGPSARNPDFPNLACSSELASYWGFPGIHPSFSVGELHFGTPVSRVRQEVA